MTSLIRSLLSGLPEPDRDAASAVHARAAQVLRPHGAMRRLDDVATHVAAWQATTAPAIRQPRVLVFAADHGVAAAGVSNYPSDVTAAMLAATRADRATINAYARAIGAGLDVVDVGVGDPTGDIRTEPAMSERRFDDVTSSAIESVDRAAAECDLLVLGELGIGNTTIAAALSAALVGGDLERWVGRGTGVDDDGLARKRAAVAAAVGRVAHITDPFDVLRQIGGAEVVAMTAACLRARHHRIPVVLDGYIATAAMLPLHAVDPTTLDHCVAGHRSAEPGHHLLLDHLGKRPLLDLELRLGEGTGAAAAVPLIKMACAAVVDVPTFDEWFAE